MRERRVPGFAVVKAYTSQDKGNHKMSGELQRNKFNASHGLSGRRVLSSPGRHGFAGIQHVILQIKIHNSSCGCAFVPGQDGEGHSDVNDYFYFIQMSRVGEK